MGENLDRIKGFIGLTVLVPLAGAAIGTIGSNLAAFGSGIGGATQTLIGAGLIAPAAKLSKSLFKL